MSSVSKAQAIAMRIAEHNPGALYKRNAAMLGMTHGQLHDYAATPSNGLPAHVDALIRGMKKRKKLADARGGANDGPGNRPFAIPMQISKRVYV